MPCARNQRASQKPSRPASKATATRAIVRPAPAASPCQRRSSWSNASSLASSFFRGWPSIPGTIAATSQLDWLISMTAMSVESGPSWLAHLGEIKDAESMSEVLRATEADTAEAIVDLNDISAAVTHAIALLDANHRNAYQAALSALPDETQEWWADSIAPKSEEWEEAGEPMTHAGIARLGQALLPP